MQPNETMAHATPPETPAPTTTSAASENKHLCPECAGKAGALTERYVYAIGRLDTRFPSLGIEREFQQRERQLFAGKSVPKNRNELITQVLEANVHLAQRLCYILSVGGIPAYILAPANASLREELLKALRISSKPDTWVVVIGRCGAVAPASACAGILAPVVSCDQIYAFTLEEWFGSIKSRLDPVLKTRKIEVADFREIVQELFARITNSAENIGGTDAHRALNYALVQHPGIFLACVERAERFALDRIETRLVHGFGMRRNVALILTFLERATCLPERLFCRVDTTEEWPFLASPPESSAPLGLQPFVENELMGLPL
jgi:hypothetical protein